MDKFNNKWEGFRDGKQERLQTWKIWNEERSKWLIVNFRKEMKVAKSGLAVSWHQNKKHLMILKGDKFKTNEKKYHAIDK